MISRQVKQQIESSSWIRKMFEDAERLRQGAEGGKICDFTLGNPQLDPPRRFQSTLVEIIETPMARKHGYMANAGFSEVRQAVAGYLSGEQGVALESRHVLMTCGASGAMNVVLKTLQNPGDEVLVSSPYFVEYGAYAANHGGVLHPVASKSDFDLDIDALAAAITPGTAAVIINSPNNPTGRVYPRQTLQNLGEMLGTRSKEVRRPIYLISDEPYRKLVYDGVEVPSVMQCYKNSIVIASYSKDLSIPGERIGLAAVHPEAEECDTLLDGLILCNRTLGYVNAPGLMQRVVARLQGECVDIDIYRRNRDSLYQGLKALGYELIKPEGAFYLFPKAPGGDDLGFVEALQRELILAVPSRGFGVSGYFRLAYCVQPEIITRALPGFQGALAAVS